MEIIWGIVYVILAPFAGGLLAGVDRKLTARMQRRVGPPVLQPFYDVLKLFGKENFEVNRLQFPFMLCHLVFMVYTGALFYSGSDMLLMIFALTVAATFLVLAAYSANSPYSFIGAQRELVLVLSAEPVLILVAAGVFKVTGTFRLYEAVATGNELIKFLPGLFLCLFYVFTIKLRKSPFDISYSHHAHQEIVKGISTEISGRTLALLEISHWYENIFLLGFIFMFFAFSPVLGVAVTLLAYLAEIVIDNSNARLRWQWTLVSSWLITLIFGGGNLVALYLAGR
ncbi:MAG: complex I subunit 1 family protein [Elusimicrobiaceae bacterium]